MRGIILAGSDLPDEMLVRVVGVLGRSPLVWATSVHPAWVRGEVACGFCLSFNNSK